jgi:DNA-binding NtrC family response regulator
VHELIIPPATDLGTQKGKGLITISFDPTVDAWREVQDRLKTIYFRALLSITGGNRDDAARLAKLSRSQLYAKLKKVSGKAADADTKEADA